VNAFDPSGTILGSDVSLPRVRRRIVVQADPPPSACTHFARRRAQGIEMEIRDFSTEDAAAVRELFIRVNRLLAPADRKDAFEIYIARSLTEEIDRVSEYYSERNGGFWVAVDGVGIVGMFGLEPSGEVAMELRRMYIDPDFRRRGTARKMLDFAEQQCRRRNRPRMNLSTSELQREALALYRNAGYALVREEVAVAASHKTLGGGIRRYHFTKAL
jgi:GNAT superfamily N-acetyltransferase